jgi:hypothetical protein
MIDNTNDTTAMRSVWSWSLSWLIRSASSLPKRDMQITLVDAILSDLRHLDTIPSLHHCFEADRRWCVTIARRLYPADWGRLGIEACTAAAFGLRVVELAYPWRGKVQMESIREGKGRYTLGEWAVW